MKMFLRIGKMKWAVIGIFVVLMLVFFLVKIVKWALVIGALALLGWGWYQLKNLGSGDNE